MVFCLIYYVASLYVYFGFHLCRPFGYNRFQRPAPEEDDIEELEIENGNVIEELQMEFHPDAAAAA